MEFILPILAIVLVPWIAGIIYIIKSISGNAGGNIHKCREDIARELKTRSEVTDDAKEKEAFIMASNYLGNPNATPTGVIHEKISTDNQNPETNITYTDTYATDSPEFSRRITANTAKPFDNINALLYVGAFLIVLAASIFIGFSGDIISGLGKTIFLAIFALMFYFLGIYLYLKTEKIKPAGLTFTTIGVVLFPFIGLSAYLLVFNHTSGNLIWFVSSLFTLIFYTISTLLIKKIYLNYLISLTALSLFESFISLFNVPVYYFFWGMSIFALCAVLIGRASKKWNITIELSNPLGFSSFAFQPISLLISLALVYQYGWLSAGINLILGSIFYILLSITSEDKNSKSANLLAGLVLLPAGVSAVLSSTILPISVISYALILIALIYALISGIVDKENDDSLIFTSVASLATVFSIFPVLSEPKTLTLVILLAIVANAVAYLLKKNHLNLILAAAGFVAIPFTYIVLYKELNQGDHLKLLSSVYFVCTLLLISLACFFNRFKQKISADIAISFSLISAFVTVCFLFSNGNSSFAILYLVLLSTIYFSASIFVEKSFNTAIGALILLIIPYFMIKVLNIDLINLSWMYSTIGVIYYLIGLLEPNNVRSKIFRSVGLLTNALAILFSFPIYSYEYNLVSYYMVSSLTVTACIFFYEGISQKTDTIKYFSGALAIIALQCAMSLWEIKELHAYMIIWAGFFGLLAYLEKIKNKASNEQTLAVLSLAFLTIPLFFQTIENTDKANFYALILGFESVCLFVSGIAFKNKLITKWGAISLLAIAIQQLKGSDWALPAIALVGIAFLAGAIYLLSKHQESQK